MLYVISPKAFTSLPSSKTDPKSKNEFSRFALFLQWVLWSVTFNYTPPLGVQAFPCLFNSKAFYYFVLLAAAFVVWSRFEELLQEMCVYQLICSKCVYFLLPDISDQYLVVFLKIIPCWCYPSFTLFGERPQKCNL